MLFLSMHEIFLFEKFVIIGCIHLKFKDKCFYFISQDSLFFVVGIIFKILSVYPELNL